MVALSEKLDGHLTPKEVRFLSCLPFLKRPGAIVEIGSFKGKSTIILAKVSKEIKKEKIVACDPLLLNSPTDPKDGDPQTLPQIFRHNLEKNDVTDYVEFHQKKSAELAQEWERAIKVLWIDGDHTYSGASLDIDLFYNHLNDGALVCLHDVLHEQEGPIRVFIEKMVLSEEFPLCGCCGSIGWGVYTSKHRPSENEWVKKLNLYKSLSKLVPYTIKSRHKISYSHFKYKIARSRVPHGEVSASRWIEEINRITRQWS